jgi:hypothetical protein
VIESSDDVRLRDVIALILGVVITVAPWFNGDDLATHGALRLRFIAIAISVVSLWIIAHQRQALAEWLNALLGILLVSTLIWRHGADAQRLDSVVAGLIVTAFSISAALQIQREVQRSSRSSVALRDGRNGTHSIENGTRF